jgi:hypothetical protein
MRAAALLFVTSLLHGTFAHANGRVNVAGFGGAVQFSQGRAWLRGDMLLHPYSMDAKQRLFNHHGYLVTEFRGTGMGPNVHFDDQVRHYPRTGVTVFLARHMPDAGVDDEGYMVLSGHRATPYGSGFRVQNGHLVTPKGNIVSAIKRDGDRWHYTYRAPGWRELK